MNIYGYQQKLKSISYLIKVEEAKKRNMCKEKLERLVRAKERCGETIRKLKKERKLKKKR